MNFLPWLSNVLGSSRNRVSGFSLASLALSGLLVCLSCAPLSAQTVSFSGTKPSVNFGDVNLCGPESQPAPCSETLALEYKVTASGRLGTPKVLTLGSPNLDFTLAEGSTCSGSVSAATTCTVKVQFVPRFAGDRIGAVEITDGSGKAIATTPIYGSGIGPQVAATLAESQPLSLSFTQPSNFISDAPFNTPSIFVTDGTGDVFGVGTDVQELPAGGGAQINLVSYTNAEAQSDGGLAIDGAGDIFFNQSADDLDTGKSYSLFSELPAGGGPSVPVPSIASTTSGPIAVDGAGNLYFTPVPVQTLELAKLPFGCKTSSCVITIESNPVPIGGMAADASGDLFLLEENASNTEIIKLPAGGGPPIVIAKAPYDGPFSLSSYGTTSLSVDGVGNIYTVVTYGTPSTGETMAVIEYPAGSSTPVTLYNLGPVDLFTPTYYTVSVDTMGDVFFYTYSYTDDGIYSSYDYGFRRSQFASLNFGSVPVGTSKTLPLEVDNIGNRPLVLRPSFISPSYKVLGASPEGCLTATAPAHSCTLSIEFRPLVKGPHTITLTLGSNGAADSVLPLEGVGTE